MSVLRDTDKRCLVKFFAADVFCHEYPFCREQTWLPRRISALQ